MSVIAVSLALVSVASQSVAYCTARQFLEAFVANPATAKHFAAKNAMIIVGDIGGPYGDYAALLESGAPWLRTCRVSQIVEKPRPTAEDLKNTPPRYRGGIISVFEGNYTCVRPDGTKVDVKFDIVLKGDRVLEVGLGEGPK